MKKTTSIFMFMMLFSIAMVSATVTVNIDPVDWASGNQNFYVTATATNEASENITSINFTISDGSTTIVYGPNTTTAAYGFNATNVSRILNVANLSDDLGADAYTLTATAYNDTGAEVGSDTEVFGADNTVPTCSQSGLTAGAVHDVSSALTVTVTGNNASSATIQFGSNSQRTMTESSDDTFTRDVSSDNPASATYDPVQIVTSDGRNSTSCADVTGVTLKDLSSRKGGTITVNKGSSGSLLKNVEAQSAVSTNGGSAQGAASFADLINAIRDFFNKIFG